MKVIGVKVPPGPNVISISQNPSGRPVIFVINNSKYAITSVDARLSPDGSSIMGMSNRVPLIDLSVLPDSWIKDVTGWLGEVYLGTIAPGAAMRFVGDDLLVSVLRTSFPIVRWIDLWGQCWEHKEGEIYQIGVNAEWRP